jgi:hypothetical protein
MRLTRMFGLAVLAAFAMSAVAASAASAAEFFHEGEGLARVIAKNEGSHKFTAGLIGTIECKKATFTGTSFVTSPQKTVTVEPVYSECTFLGISGVVVKTNGCTYTFNQPTGTGPFTGTVTVNCPAGKSIEFEATGCKIEVGAQGPLSSVTFTNLATTPKLVKVAASVSKITYTASGSCTVLGKKEDGSYSGIALSDAETEGGELVGGFIK